MKNELKTPAEWQKILSEKDSEITQLRQQVEWLTQQLRLMQGRQFSSSSEKTTVSSEQISLFNQRDAGPTRSACSK